MEYIKVGNLNRFFSVSGIGERPASIFGVRHVGFYDLFFTESERDGFSSYAFYATSGGDIEGCLKGRLYCPGTPGEVLTEAAETGYAYLAKNAIDLSSYNSDEEQGLIRLVTVEDIDIRGTEDTVRTIFSALREPFYDEFRSELVVWKEIPGLMPEGGYRGRGYLTGFLSITPASFDGDVLIL